MKKPINIIAVGISIIVSIGVIVGAVLLILHFTGDKASENISEALETTHFELLRSTKMTEVKRYAEEGKIELAIADDGKIGILSGVDIVNKRFDIFFYTNGSDDLTRIDASCTITINKPVELEKALSTIANAVGKFFNLENEPYYAIFDMNGADIDESVEDPILELLNGKAKFVLTAIDKDGTYWNLSIKKNEENTYGIDFFHAFEKGVYENGSEVINLTGPKE